MSKLALRLIEENKRTDDTVLDLSFEKLGNSPLKNIKDHIWLKELKLQECEITDISFLQNLKQLEYLVLTNNQIQEYSSLQHLSELKTLFLSFNQIGDYSFLQHLSELKTLYLNNCKITDISFLRNLKQLQALYLNNNRIENISFLENLTQLQTLDLYNNKVQDIKSLMPLLKKGLDINLTANLEETNEIRLNFNPITNPPLEIVEQGREAVIEYFEGKLKPLNECKLIFVGDGQVGKTSLMRQLVYNTFNPNEETTHGINKVAWQDLTNEKGEPIKVNLWDFGGQHIQHSLHQFFFTQRVVYVLVLNPRNDQRANYWLEQIEKLGDNSEILVVYNWKDPKDTQADCLSNFYELRKTYPQLQEPFWLSCRTGEGVAEFKSVLRKSILANEGLKAQYREEWFHIKNRLEREVPIETNYIFFETYEQWCKEANYTDPERQKTLLKILDSVGSIVFFDRPILNQWPILNPEWISTGAYAVLVAEETKRNKGHLSWDDLKAIFKTPKEIFSNKTIRIQYTETHFQFILELMLTYDLCQKSPTQKHEYLIPSAFDGTPNRNYQEEKTNTRRYRIQFEAPFEMLVIHRFIAKNILRTQGKDYWHSGIYIKHPFSETHALIETNQYSNQINCWIQGEDIRGLWELIRVDFREIFSSYKNFTPKEQVGYISDGAMYFLDYHEMSVALRNGVKLIEYHPVHFIRNIDVLAVLDLFEDRNKTTERSNNDISINVSPIITVNPHFEQNN